MTYVIRYVLCAICYMRYDICYMMGTWKGDMEGYMDGYMAIWMGTWKGDMERRVIWKGIIEAPH